MTITQAIDFGVRRAATTDRTAVAATVAAAFFDDPLTQWLLPDVVRRQEVILPAFEAYVDPYLPHGETYLTSDSNGAAVWLPPNTELFTADQEHAFGEALADLLGPDADRAFRLGEIFANHHPDEPLYYCQFLATVPAFQAAASGRPSSGTCCSAPTPRGCRRTTKRRRPGTGPCTSGTATSATESSHCPTAVPPCGACGGIPASQHQTTVPVPAAWKPIDEGAAADAAPSSHLSSGYIGHRFGEFQR
jgi:hypothetical protein